MGRYRPLSPHLPAAYRRAVDNCATGSMPKVSAATKTKKTATPTLGAAAMKVDELAATLEAVAAVDRL